MNGCALSPAGFVPSKLEFCFERNGEISADLYRRTVHKVRLESPIPDLFDSRIGENNILGNRRAYFANGSSAVQRDVNCDDAGVWEVVNYRPNHGRSFQLVVLKASLPNLNKTSASVEAGVVSNSKEGIAIIIKLLKVNHIGSDSCLLVEEFERARNILWARLEYRRAGIPLRVAHGSRRATTKDENELEMS